ncbi:MAG: ABC transporter substrate-binding protein [Pseudomonadota bacterium]
MRQCLLLLALSVIVQATLACEAPADDASRIAVAGGSLTEILYFLDQQDRIVAVDSTSNFPEEASQFPSVGYVRALSAEGVLSLAPTLVLGEDDMGPPAVLSQLESTGVPSVMVPEVHTADGIVSKIRCVASVLGISEEAEVIIESELADELAALSEIQARQPGRKPRGAVLLGLRDGSPLGAGANTSGNGLLEMAGAENVLAGFDGWKPLSLEAMIAADPEFIVIPTRGLDDAGGHSALLDQPGINLTTAARDGRLIDMDGMTMLGFGPRTLSAAVELAAKLQSGELTTAQ